MNHTEQQVRAALAALMGPAEHLAQRQAQINGLRALMNPGVVATLLQILDETRRDAVSVLSLAVEQTSPDNPAWARAVEHSQYLFELLQASGASCTDEGCDHYGTPHGHTEPPAPPQREPIPVGVYYDGAAYRFREVGTAKDMGYDFYTRWKARVLEFPTVPRNPASVREIQPGMPGFNAGDKRKGST